MENCGFMNVFMHVSESPDCNLLFQGVGKRAKSGGCRPSLSSCFEEKLWLCKVFPLLSFIHFASFDLFATIICPSTRQCPQRDLPKPFTMP